MEKEVDKVVAQEVEEAWNVGNVEVKKKEHEKGVKEGNEVSPSVFGLHVHTKEIGFVQAILFSRLYTKDYFY